MDSFLCPRVELSTTPLETLLCSALVRRGASQEVHLLPPRAAWDALVRRAAASESDGEPDLCGPETAPSAPPAAGAPPAGAIGTAGEGAEAEADAEAEAEGAAAAASSCAIPLPFGWERALDARNREYFIK